jgi:hypothetical protein
MAQIKVLMSDTGTRTYDGTINVLEGGVLLITPDEEQYPLVFLSAQIWVEANQAQRKPGTPKIY